MATSLPTRTINTLQDDADPVVAAISTLLIAVTVMIVLVVGLLVFVRAEAHAPARMAGPCGRRR